MVVDEKERKGKRSIQSREKYIGIAGELTVKFITI